MKPEDDGEFLLRGERGDLSKADAERFEERVASDGDAREYVGFVNAMRQALTDEKQPDADLSELRNEARGNVRPPARTAWRSFAAAALVLVIGALAVLQPWTRGGPSPRLEALSVRIPRSEVESEFRTQRLAGLGSYRDGDYERAARELGRATELEPEDAQVKLYLGSALLLSGRAADARAPLREAARLEEGNVRLEALWQLAQAELSLGSEEEATSLLRRIRNHGTLRARDAAEQLGE